MADRRSLGVALNLTPEKQAFIQGGPAAAAAPAPVAPATQVSPTPAIEQEADEPEVQPVTSERPVRRSRGRRQARAPLPQGDDVFLGVANLLVPLTTRLQPTTFAALKRAGLEQKLRGQSPGTVQEIAEEAIQSWLRDCGYLE